jgi:N-acylneuraminate cytidylyltransferase
MVKAVGLIPARSGSKRIPNKNIKLLNGKPLMLYAIDSALESGIFTDIIVSTDAKYYADIAQHYGAFAIMCPLSIAHRDDTKDIDWIKYTMEQLKEFDREYDCFSILRPTSPFRTGKTIKRAWNKFLSDNVDSLRAVEPCKQHPCKMWYVNGDRMTPLYPNQHSQPYQTLPLIHVQNASLEIAWTRVLDEDSISGFYVMPFFTKGYEGFDINTEDDWILAEELIKRGVVKC